MRSGSFGIRLGFGAKAFLEQVLRNGLEHDGLAALDVSARPLFYILDVSKTQAILVSCSIAFEWKTGRARSVGFNTKGAPRHSRMGSCSD